MRRIKSFYGYASKTVIWELTEEEQQYSDELLLLLADGRTLERAQAIIQNGEHPGHFGGQVERFGKVVKIKVYTD